MRWSRGSLNSGSRSRKARKKKDDHLNDSIASHGCAERRRVLRHRLPFVLLHGLLYSCRYLCRKGCTSVAILDQFNTLL